jgi:Fic family protein
MDIFDEIDLLQAEINEQRPLERHLLAQIKEYFRIGLTYTSNALEGNTLTESETKIVLEEGVTIGGKPLKDHMEAVGHSQAYDFVYQCIQRKQIDELLIQELHRLFYYRIDLAQAGVYRTQKVYITGSKYPVTAPENIADAMAAFIERLASMRTSMHPVARAAIAHKEFVFIHPFIDGNGRVARLLMNLILLQEGYTIAIIPPIMRAAYMSSLEEAHTNDKKFLLLIAQMVKETQRDFLRLFGE